MRYDKETQRLEYTRLAHIEGWDVTKNPVDGSDLIIADGREFPLLHPYQIHLRLYRDGIAPEGRLQHFIAVHNMLWPEHVQLHNYWQERIFTAHCERWKIIVLAGGSSCGKSQAAAKVALIFWLSNPTKNACLVASTTLDSLESRIWGYVIKLAETAALPIPIRIIQGKPQKLVYPKTINKLHGMFATAIKQGVDTRVINNLIGRHPEKGLMLVLDEATDMPPAIVDSIPNLEEVAEMFQCFAIGNSSDKTDLHGALATPKHGWKSIDPETDFAWETLRPGGICLYFNPNDSPAIKDPDPVKRALIGKFLINQTRLNEKIRQYGTDSDSYYRFVLGFWRMTEATDTAMSTVFLEEHNVNSKVEWLGINPLYTVAGLDPAFKLRGKGCILRLAIWGQTTSGKLVLDYRDTELLFRLKTTHSTGVSVEQQVASQVCDILKQYHVPLRLLTVDSTGVGRVLPELIRHTYVTDDYALKLISAGNKTSRRTIAVTESLDNVICLTPTDMWDVCKDFLLQDHIKGLDAVTQKQLTTRKMLTDEKSGLTYLEPKHVYIVRMGAVDPKLAHSPDEADAAILALMTAVHRLGFIPGMRWAVPDNMKLDPYSLDKLTAFMQAKKDAAMIQDVEGNRAFVRLEPNFSAPLEDGIDEVAG